jgi:hypothetical protein
VIRAVVFLALSATIVDAGNARVQAIPQVAQEIRCDGELDELAWHTPLRTGPFTDDRGNDAAPYSEARFLRSDRELFLALYAADENIRSTDEFVVDFRSAAGRSTLHFTAGGKLTPAVAGARLAIDADGVVDDATDDDEEWVVEAAIPLASVPFDREGRVTVRVSRCDTTKDGKVHCGHWAGAVQRR